MRRPVTMLNCLSHGPAAVLAELGFTQEGLIFRRKVGDVHNVVECQLHDIGTGGDGEFVFELGARHPRVHEVMGARPSKKPPVAPGACTVKTRVNRDDSGNDTWWKLTPGREAATGAHAAERLRKTIEPWFTVANDLVALNDRVGERNSDFWVSDSLGPAAIAIVLGQTELGRARIEQQLKEIHAWREYRLDRFRRNDPYGTAVLEQAHFMTTGKHTKRFRINQYQWEQVRY